MEHISVVDTPEGNIDLCVASYYLAGGRDGGKHEAQGEKAVCGMGID